MNFTDYILESGLVPPGQTDDMVVGPRWINLRITTEEAVLSHDLGAPAVLATDGTVNARLVKNSSSNRAFLLYIAAVQLVGFNDVYNALDVDDKATLVSAAQLSGDQNNVPFVEDLGLHFSDSQDAQWATFDSDSTDAIVQRGILNGEPKTLENPYLLNLETDSLALKWREAPPVGVELFVRLFGIMAPNTVQMRNGDLTLANAGCITCKEGRVTRAEQARFGRGVHAGAIRRAGRGVR